MKKYHHHLYKPDTLYRIVDANDMWNFLNIVNYVEFEREALTKVMNKESTVFKEFTITRRRSLRNKGILVLFSTDRTIYKITCIVKMILLGMISIDDVYDFIEENDLKVTKG